MSPLTEGGQGGPASISWLLGKRARPHSCPSCLRQGLPRLSLNWPPPALVSSAGITGCVTKPGGPGLFFCLFVLDQFCVCTTVAHTRPPAGAGPAPRGSGARRNTAATWAPLLPWPPAPAVPQPTGHATPALSLPGLLQALAAGHGPAWLGSGSIPGSVGSPREAGGPQGARPAPQVRLQTGPAEPQQKLTWPGWSPPRFLSCLALPGPEEARQARLWPVCPLVRPVCLRASGDAAWLLST